MTAALRQNPSWLVLFLLGSFGALAPLTVDMYLPAVSALSRELQASPAQSTSALSIFLVGMVVGQLIAGPWSDRVGRRPVLIGGMGLLLAGSFLCALTPSIELLLAGRLIQALGGSAVMVAGRATVTDYFGGHRAASVFSALAAVGVLAPILAPFVGSAILGVAGWRSIFHVMGALTLIILIVTITNLPESRDPAFASGEARPNPLHGLLSVIGNARVTGLLLAAAFNGACFFTYLAVSPLVLMQVYDVQPAQYGMIVAANSIALLIVTQINRVLLRSRSPLHILGYARVASLMLAAAVATWALTQFGGFVGLLGLIFLAVASTGFVQSNAMASALAIDPARAGAAAALYGAFGFAAGSAASVLAGVLYDGTARGMMLIIAIASLGSALTLHFVVIRDGASS